MTAYDGLWREPREAGLHSMVTGRARQTKAPRNSAIMYPTRHVECEGQPEEPARALGKPPKNIAPERSSALQVIRAWWHKTHGIADEDRVTGCHGGPETTGQRKKGPKGRKSRASHLPIHRAIRVSIRSMFRFMPTRIGAARLTTAFTSGKSSAAIAETGKVSGFGRPRTPSNITSLSRKMASSGPRPKDRPVRLGTRLRIAASNLDLPVPFSRPPQGCARARARLRHRPEQPPCSATGSLDRRPAWHHHPIAMDSQSAGHGGFRLLQDPGRRPPLHDPSVLHTIPVASRRAAGPRSWVISIFAACRRSREQAGRSMRAATGMGSCADKGSFSMFRSGSPISAVALAARYGKPPLRIRGRFRNSPPPMLIASISVVHSAVPTLLWARTRPHAGGKPACAAQIHHANRIQGEVRRSLEVRQNRSLNSDLNSLR